MSMSLNKVQIIGNLTRDPELRQIPGGQVVATFGVATNFTWNDSSGQKQTKTEFHNVVVWRRLAEICAQYLKKGSKAYFEGRLQTRDWEGEDGVKRYRTEIVVDNMIMLDSRGNPMGDNGMQAVPMERSAGGIDQDDSSSQETANASSGGSEEEVSIDDLPF